MNQTEGRFSFLFSFFFFDSIPQSSSFSETSVKGKEKTYQRMSIAHFPDLTILNFKAPESSIDFSELHKTRFPGSQIVNCPNVRSACGCLSVHVLSVRASVSLQGFW